MNAIFQHLERLTRDRFWELAAWELWKQRAAGVWWAWVVPHPFRLPCRTQPYCREPALAEDCISWSPVVLQFCDSVSLSWAVPVTTDAFGKEEKLYCIFLFQRKATLLAGEKVPIPCSQLIFSLLRLYEMTQQMLCPASQCTWAVLVHLWCTSDSSHRGTAVVLQLWCFLSASVTIHIITSLYWSADWYLKCWWGAYPRISYGQI